MKYFFYIISITILSLISCVEKIAPTTGSVSGVVKDSETAQPLTGCNVILMPTGESTITGSDGTFHFEDVFPDDYSVEATYHNYYSNKKSIVMLAGNTISVDIPLIRYDPNNKLAELGAISVDEVMHNSVRVSSEIITQGSSSITESGFLYSELSNITIATATKVIVSSGVGTFSTTIKNLVEKTTYYIAPYAVNGRGTAYGDIVSFTTGDASTIFPPTPDNVIFVSVSGNDLNNGLSWDKAKKTIEAAIDLAVEGKQIWVSEGSFEESINPKNGVNIYGGFSGVETDINQRKERTTVMGAYCEDFTQETVINGFVFDEVVLKDYSTLENCIISKKKYIEFYYHYIVKAEGDNITIKGCIFDNNKDCALYAKGESLKVINSHFRDNNYVYFYSATFYNCLFSNNSLRSEAKVSFYNCTFSNNESDFTTSCLYNCIVWNDSEFKSSTNLYNCIVVSGANNDAVKFKNPATDWKVADWSITAGSSCINAGKNIYFPIDEIPTDIAGNSRIIGSIIDIGAYEY